MEAIKIVDTLLGHARGKLCSRYVLALERVKESLEVGSPSKALREQEDWFDNLRKRRNANAKPSNK